MRLVTQAIPRVAPMSVEAFHEQWRRPGKPVVIEGALEEWPARRLLTFEWLRARWGDREARLNKSIPGATTMRLDDYLDAIAQGTAGGRYLDATPLSWLPGIEDVLRPLPWIPSDRTLQRLIWVGPAGTVLPFHKDNQTPLDGNHNLFAQLVGRKRFLLVAPADEACMYPLPLEPHAYAKSAVDLAALERFPRFADATVHEAIVGPGDVLFNPAHWWHHVESLEPSISVSAWWRASRVIELTRALGVALRDGDAAADRWLGAQRATITPDDVAELGGPEKLRALWAPLSPQARRMCDTLLRPDAHAMLEAHA